MEVWKDIPQYEGYYQISSHGRVKTVARRMNNRSVPEKIRKPNIMKGYHCIVLKKDGTIKVFRIHRLVAENFIGSQPDERYQVDHVDGNKANNCVDNLEWVLPQENTRRAIENELRDYTPEHREKVRQAMVKRWRNPDYRKSQCEMAKRMWSNPAHKVEHSLAIKEGIQKARGLTYGEY